jgi:hypothetical protein
VNPPRAASHIPDHAPAIHDQPLDLGPYRPTRSPSAPIQTPRVSIHSPGGANWYEGVTGFANVPVFTLTFDNSGRLFAFTHGRSAWRVTPTP